MGTLAKGCSQSFLDAEREISRMREELKKNSEALASQRRQRDDLESELRTVLERDGDIRASEIDVSQEVVVDYDRLLNLEADLHEMAEEHAAHQAQLNKAFQNIELVFKRAQLEDQLAKLRREASGSDVPALEGRARMLEEELSRAQLELQISQDEALNERIGSEQRMEKMLKMAEDFEYLFSRLPSKRRHEDDGKGRVASHVLAELESLKWSGDVSKEEAVLHFVDELLPRFSSMMGFPKNMLVAEELIPDRASMSL